jgi:hypothetical protein
MFNFKITRTIMWGTFALIDEQTIDLVIDNL